MIHLMPVLQHVLMGDKKVADMCRSKRQTLVKQPGQFRDHTQCQKNHDMAL
jgi:hypothetical protein